jgi:signal transduction histidine kinase
VVVIDKFSRVIDLNPAAERLIGEKKSVLTGHQILMKQEESEGDVSPGIKNLQIIGGVKFEEEYLKCWEHFKCEKEGCPAYKSEEWRCWLMPDTHCHAPDGILENFETKAERCSNCELLTRIKEEYNPAKETESREVAIDIPRRDIRVFKTPMFDSGDSFLGNVMVLQDITKENEIDKMKSEFVSTVSHELRTPLSSIKSFAELLLDDLDTLDIETQKKFLGIINNESDRLTRLISGLLDLQKMTSNKMKWNMENIQLSQVVKSCVETFSSLGNKKNIDLNYECDDQLPLVYGDRDKLQQVLYNLISNALKFNEKRGKKKEKVKVEARNDHRGVMITVSDTGIGIPEEKLDMIFERFYQVDSSNTRKTEGTGLGLAICKEIIDCHGGEIWVDSEIGKGSKFSFIIPRVATEDIFYDQT